MEGAALGAASQDWFRQDMPTNADSWTKYQRGKIPSQSYNAPHTVLTRCQGEKPSNSTQLSETMGTEATVCPELWYSEEGHMAEM